MKKIFFLLVFTFTIISINFAQTAGTKTENTSDISPSKLALELGAISYENVNCSMNYFSVRVITKYGELNFSISFLSISRTVRIELRSS